MNPYVKKTKIYFFVRSAETFCSDLRLVYVILQIMYDKRVRLLVIYYFKLITTDAVANPKLINFQPN